ncbi:MAG: acetylornithine deacetylase [Silvibacterium sp.]
MNDVVEHLKNLIRIPSVSSLSNRPIIDYAVETLHEAQWQTRQMVYIDAAGIEKVNVIAAPQGQNVADPAAELAFVCHTDTVPYSPDWTRATEPFVADGLVYGCGACDVKGFLACLLTSITEVNPSMLIHGLRLILTADEEIGCIGTTHLIAADLIRPERMVIGEPTSLHVARAGKGYCLAEITVFGQEAHSAHPQKGKSAIYRAARLITAIEEFGSQLSEEQHSFFSPGFTTLNVGTIQGGTAKNIISGQCSFQLEWRPIPSQSADAVPAAVSRIVEKLQEIDPDFRWKLEIVRKQHGFETRPDSRLVQSIETRTGRKATSIPFGSEASLFANIAEEVVVFGPGDMQTAHSSRECIPFSELEEAVVVLKSLMTAGAAPPVFMNGMK